MLIHLLYSKATKSTMPKGARPDEITDWISSGRSFRTLKPIRSMSVFEDRFMTWWSNSQPADRLKDESGWPVADIDGMVHWDAIRFTGRNGLLSVVFALFLWGVTLGSDEARGKSGRWFRAVSDVEFVFRRLVESASVASVTMAGATLTTGNPSGHTGAHPETALIVPVANADKENGPQKRKLSARAAEALENERALAARREASRNKKYVSSTLFPDHHLDIAC